MCELMPSPVFLFVFLPPHHEPVLPLASLQAIFRLGPITVLLACSLFFMNFFQEFWDMGVGDGPEAFLHQERSVFFFY